MPSWRVGGKVARNIYCDDVEVAVAVGALEAAAQTALEITTAMNSADEPLLGLASTRQLLEEIKPRAEITTPFPHDRYRRERDAVRAVLADRERELLELKGPCSNRSCRLHHAHSGPCDVDA